MNMDEEKPQSTGNSSSLHDESFSTANHGRKSPKFLLEGSAGAEHLANLNLKAENEELKEQLFQLKTELQDEKSNERYLRREQHMETQSLKEEERKKTQAMVTETRRKLYKEKQQEIAELRERLHSDKEKEISHVVKQKDEELRKAQQNWVKEQEELLQKVRVRCSNEMRLEAENSYKKQLRKLENCVEELKEQKKQVEETCKLAQEADKRKAHEIRRIHSEHENELAKLKRSSWQEGRKQMTEIRQLTNIIYQLEKKLGVESGHYIRLQMEKDNLRDKFDRVKGSSGSGRHSPLPSKGDLTSDLSMFSFLSPTEDSNPLWLQLKQQKNIITQLKKNLQDKDRRIDLLKQKLFKNHGRFGNGGALHRSMDDMYSYATASEREDCMSPEFGCSTGSSDASSLNDESLRSDESQDTEIIRKLQKELLLLERAYSLLQAESASTLDVRRSQMEKEQLQTDLIEAHRTIDEQNKDMSELQDRIELLEFQQAESSQLIDDEDTPNTTGFNIPTLRVHYEFTDEELECSAEEVKAKLEELENEKKSVFERDEQLTIIQARRLIERISKGEPENICTTKEHILVNDSEDGLLELSFPNGVCPVTRDVSTQCQLFDVKYEIYDYREEIVIIHEGRTFKETKPNIECGVQCNIFGIETYEGVEVIEIEDDDSTINSFRKVVKSYDSETQTDFGELQTKLTCENVDFSESMESDVFELDGFQKLQESTYEPDVFGRHQFSKTDGNKLARETSVGGRSSDFSELDDSLENNTREFGVQCSITDLMKNNDYKVIQPLDENSEKYMHKNVSKNDTSVIPKISESAVQCNLVEFKRSNEREILEIHHEFGSLRFGKLCESHDSETQTDFPVRDVVEGSGDVIKATDWEGGEDSFQEKHDGEISEKAMIEETWKGFINEKELGKGAKQLDCIVYEKEEILIVICESCPTSYKGVLIHDWHEELSESIHFGEGAEAILGDRKDRPVSGNKLTNDNVENRAANQVVDRNAEEGTTLGRNDVSVDGSGRCPNNSRGSTGEDNLCLHCSRYDVVFVDKGIQFPGDDVAYDVTHTHDSCPDEAGVPGKNEPCLSCGHRDVISVSSGVQFPEEGSDHREVTSVDCSVQCELTDLLSSSFDLLEFSGVSELSSVFHESDNSVSLIQEVRELARECHQNGQHLIDVVKNQDYYEDYESGNEVDSEGYQEVMYADAAVECLILTVPLLCDQQTECIMGENDVDRCLGPKEYSEIGIQCILGKGGLPREIFEGSDPESSIPTCDQQTQCSLSEYKLVESLKESSDIGIQCSSEGKETLHDSVADANVQCSILNFVESCEQETQRVLGEREIVQSPETKQLIDIGVQCISTEALREILADANIQCSILNVPDTCDQETQCITDENDCEQPQDAKQDADGTKCILENFGHSANNANLSEVFADASSQCSILNFVETCTRGIQSLDLGVNCDILRVCQTFDQETQCLVFEDDNERSEEQRYQDVETQCNYSEILGCSDKATQCNFMVDGHGKKEEYDEIEGPNIYLNQKDMSDKTMFELASLKVKNEELLQQVVELKIQAKRETEENVPKQLGASLSFSPPSRYTATVRPSRNGRTEERGREESVITAEQAVFPESSLDLENVFREMEAEPSAPIFEMPIKQAPSPAESIDNESVDTPEEFPRSEPRPEAEESTITRTFKDLSMNTLDLTLDMFGAESLEGDNRDSGSASGEREDRLGRILAGEAGDKLDGASVSEDSPEDSGEQSLPKLSQDSSSEEDFNIGYNSEDSLPPDGRPPAVSDYPPPMPDNCSPVGNDPPLIPDYPPPIPDYPPPIPDSPPPALPSMSPPEIVDDDLDDDIEALLADENAGVPNPPGVRPTLDREVKELLESECSPMSSEPDTVLSMDSLCANQICHPKGILENVSSNKTAVVQEQYVDVTEMLPSDEASFEHDDIISPTTNDSSVETLAVTPEQSEYDHFEPTTSVAMETTSRNYNKTLESRVVFDPVDSTSASSSSDSSQRRKTPPPVLPKPKYRSLSLNLPLSELPRAPVENRGNRPHPPNSMAAQRDMVDGHFPPRGLVPKRASEFNLGEFDLLKERIVFLERQLKNKENLLQTIRAEATEIETNAYIQKKEEDMKMMNESIRFLKQENQKKEKELIIKIGELNKCNFELDQCKSERSNSEKQQEKMEETISNLQNQLHHLQSADVKFQELKCKCSRLENENGDLQEQVNRLYRADQDFVELEKNISSLQAKLNELDDVKRERDEFNEQLQAIKNQKDDLMQKGRKVETERNDFLMNNKLMEQQKENLEARNKALQRTNDTFKTKISNLEKEFRDCQRKSFDAQRERDSSSSQLRKMETERDEMRKRVNELLQCKSDLKQSQSKCRDFERELNYLTAQCKKLDGQRNELSSELNNCLKERNRLEGRTAELEQLSRGNEKLEEKFHTLKLKIAELTSQRDDAEVQLPTLKAKVALLKKACKEKDEQLEKMKEEIQELKHSIATSALDDLSKIRSFGFGSPENYMKFGTDVNNTNKGFRTKSEKGEKYVVLFDYDPSRLSTTGHPENELKLSEGDVITVYGEMDLNGYYMGEFDGNRGLVSSLYIEEMDEYDTRKLNMRQLQHKNSPSPKKPPAIPVSSPKVSTIPSELVKRPFVALQDYNPYNSSNPSSRPDLEIPLAAGEVVIVVGDVDANGYYSVEKRGRLALIPSNLVKPGSPSLLQPKKASPFDTLGYTSVPGSFAVPGSLSVPGPGPSSTVPSFSTVPGFSTVPPKSIIPGLSSAPGTLSTNGFDGAVPARLSMVPVQTTGEFTSVTSTIPNGITENSERHSQVGNIRGQGAHMRIKNEPKSLGLPSAPKNLRVLRCVNKDALLVGWLAPEIDEMGRNNGQVVKGYKIFANGEIQLQVDSPYMAKALLENLDLSRPIELSIQTEAENGFCSEKTVAHFNEAVMLETTFTTTEDVTSLDENASYRTSVALYTYDPFKNSPNPNPTAELGFQEGDIIRIIDTSRPDGFYVGQVAGKQGLVPSNFIEEIAVAARPHSMKPSKFGNGNSSHNSSTSPRGNSSSHHGQRKTKVMVALADYDPPRQSSNALPDGELSFRKGQLIRVLGHMRPDGFYEADVDGKRGLVPSNYLKACKRKSSKSPHSTNGHSSLPRRVQFVNHEDDRHVPNDYV